VGTGEKLDQIELFHPERMASRILGMGDMLTLIEKAEQQYDEEQAKKLEEKLRKNKLTLTDYLEQLEQLQNMGDLSEMMGMIPGMGNQLKNTQIDEKQMARTRAIIQSMTPKERENPQILNASRKRRIAAGCGQEVSDVNRLLKSFEMLQQLTKSMGKGKMRGIPNMGGMPMGGGMSRMHGFGRKKRLK
jgi:signal recognition particle subunit SRP54